MNWRRRAVPAAILGLLCLVTTLGHVSPASRSVAITVIGAALKSPLALFAERSPGERGSGQLLLTKPERKANASHPEERVLAQVRDRDPPPDTAPAGTGPNPPDNSGSSGTGNVPSGAGATSGSPGYRSAGAFSSGRASGFGNPFFGFPQFAALPATSPSGSGQSVDPDQGSHSPALATPPGAEAPPIGPFAGGGAPPPTEPSSPSSVGPSVPGNGGDPIFDPPLGGLANSDPQGPAAQDPPGSSSSPSNGTPPPSTVSLPEPSPFALMLTILVFYAGAGRRLCKRAI